MRNTGSGMPSRLSRPTSTRFSSSITTVRTEPATLFVGMGHLGDKLALFEGFSGDNEQGNREAMLEEARRRGATHILMLAGDEVYADDVLSRVVYWKCTSTCRR